MLFNESRVTGLFGFENRKAVFEGVDSRFKFVVLTFEKGTRTDKFPVAFMRHDVKELDRFPSDGTLFMDVDLVRKLSPDSLSLMEFKSDADVHVAKKMLRYPLLGEKLLGQWCLELHREFNMTDDAFLFHKRPSTVMIPLYEGKMIHHFTHLLSDPRYWVSEKQGRKALLGEEKDIGSILGYQKYRLAYRSIASNTNERTLISTVIPPSFTGNSLNVDEKLADKIKLFCVAVLNSFVVDWLLRQKVTTNINMFYIYQLPVPRLAQTDAILRSIAVRAAKLICTTPEFDELARTVDLQSHKNGVTDPAKRAQLRAELDGMIAHLYELTEEEFSRILNTFPLVEQGVRDAALEAYKALAPKPGDQEVAELIAKGESAELEFKSSARWDIRQNKLNKEMEQIVVKTAAAFLNSETGGTLLIGVEDSGTVLGLEHDFKTLGKRQDRDGYENFLTTLLLGNYGKDSSPLIQIRFHQLDGKDVCCIIAKPSPKPVFVKDGNNDHLFIRAGNSTRLLSTKEAIDYCKLRWRN